MLQFQINSALECLKEIRKKKKLRKIHTAWRECLGVEDGWGAIGIKDGAVDRKDTPISLEVCPFFHTL